MSKNKDRLEQLLELYMKEGWFENEFTSLHRKYKFAEAYVAKVQTHINEETMSPRALRELVCEGYHMAMLCSELALNGTPGIINLIQLFENNVKQEPN